MSIIISLFTITFGAFAVFREERKSTIVLGSAELARSVRKRSASSPQLQKMKINQSTLDNSLTIIHSF
jgi:hypothetical protein